MVKNILFAPVVLALTGSAALAEVRISGNGRFGVEYLEANSQRDISETQINYRLRFDIDAIKETDSGVTFSGRIRLQYQNGDRDPVSGAGGAALSPARIGARYQGLELEVGNVGTAYDSSLLMYNTEMGTYFRSPAGNPRGQYFAFSTRPYPSDQNNRMGLAVFYSGEGFNLRASWVTVNQTGLRADPNCGTFDPGPPATCSNPGFGLAISDDRPQEYGISGDYTWNAFTISAAAVWNGAAIRNNDNYFLGAQYALNEDGQVGILYFDNGNIDPNNVSSTNTGGLGNQVTLYTNYTFGDIRLQAYIAANDAPSNDNDVGGGLGFEYDIGGALLTGSLQQGYDSYTIADLGVRWTF